MQSKFARAIETARRTGELSVTRIPITSTSEAAELLLEIRKLPHVSRIDWAYGMLGELPEWFPELTKLELLGLTHTSIHHFPQVLLKLPQLAYLELSANYIEELPASIGNLKNLQILDLGDNRLSALPQSTGSLRKLTHLYLWGNDFKEIPDALSALGNLKLLDLSVQGRRDLIQDTERPPFQLDHVIGITYPNSSARIKSIPAWFPISLPSLRELYLGGQEISELPASLAVMRNLRGLHLSGNRLREFPEAITELQELERLDLSGNQITELPTSLLRLGNLTYLDLRGNPLPLPPEILERTSEPQAILEYVARLHQETRPLDEAKVLVVGEASVGKTSLVKRLVHNTYSAVEGKTEGIAVTRWPVSVGDGSITLNAWDFGGQEIMHATHQFFLTKRSVYVLVVDSRQGEEQNRIEYWLKLIQGFSDNSPVIIVGNKIDEQPLDIDHRGLKSKYANIVDIVPVSCKTGAGINEIKASLARTVGGLPHVTDALPIPFFGIKRHLEGLTANYLTFAEYRQLCADRGVTADGAQELLIGFLHDLGTVLCFRDDPRLADTNILNPSWVTGGVYRLLNSNLAASRKGLLRWRDINKILNSNDYPAERRSFIIDMMKKFELCHEANELYLVPDLLTKEEPDTGNWDDALHFEIKYDVLPLSIISRLIVRLNALISKGTVWRTGMVLALDGNRALVKGDCEDSVITIDVSGPSQTRRGLLTAVRVDLRGIERTIPGLTVEERVPVPGHPGFWVPYKHLLDLERADRRTVVPQGLHIDISIRAMLAGIESPADRAALVIEKPPVTVREPAAIVPTQLPERGFFLWRTPWRRAGTILVGFATVAGTIAAILALFIK